MREADGTNGQKKLLKNDGHKVIEKGKKSYLVNFEKKVVEA